MATSNLKNIAVILAGGSGARMKHHEPKHFIKIAGLPIIEHTILVMQTSQDIDEIIIMITPGFKQDIQKIIEGKNYSKITQIVEGGKTRNETTELALAAIDEEECNVLFHDAVRPLLSSRIIRQCVNALRHHNAVDVAIPSADTIIEVEDNIIQQIPARARLMRGQTPQGFKLSTIRQAYEISKSDKHFQATDDCGVVLKYLPNVPIFVVEGADQNMKITHPIDIYLADRLFQLSSVPAEKYFSDKVRADDLSGKTIVVFGGSYGIGKDIADLAKEYGADVFVYSRSTTNTDVKNEKDIKSALLKAHNQTGRIDYVVNTAGLLNVSKLENTKPETIAEMIAINYTAPIIMARLSLPYLKETKGQLLLFTSSSYTRGRSDYSIYSSSKAAVVNLAQALSEEWAPHGVRINCINPERTATPMRKKAFGQEDPDTLLDSKTVAQASLDTLISDLHGQVVDIRRKDFVSTVAG